MRRVLCSAGVDFDHFDYQDLWAGPAVADKNAAEKAAVPLPLSSSHLDSQSGSALT